MSPAWTSRLESLAPLAPIPGRAYVSLPVANRQYCRRYDAQAARIAESKEPQRLAVALLEDVREILRGKS